MPSEPASRSDGRPPGRGHDPAAATAAASDHDPFPDEQPPWWRSASGTPGAGSAAQRSRPERLLGWLRPTPAELVGLVLLVLGSVVATVVWWGQSVTSPAGTDQLGGPAAEQPGEPAPPPTAAAGPATGMDVADGTGAAGDGADAAGSFAAAVTVHVSGAVSRPGLVTLPAGGRVGDAVLAAGGLTAEADTARVNLARALADGEHVHLPRVGEELPEPIAPVGGAASGAAGEATGSTGDGPLDLNRASAAELEELPGIGPSRAAAIVEHRERNGPFAVPGDLRGVPGIGEATFQTLAPLVVAR